MFTVTLLTSPACQLNHALADSLRIALGGGAIRWLNPDVALEFEIPQPPANATRIQEHLQGEGIDMVIQPSANRRKHLLLADMDSTMIRQECIDELATEAGVGDHVAAITARAMNGELAFEAALRARVEHLKGIETCVIDTVLNRRLTYMPGGATLVATMKAHGAHCSLISGGFTAFTARVAADLGFDDHRANRLLTKGGRLTGQVAEPILGRDAKVTRLHELTARLGLTAADVLAVGDGANDLGMLGLAGTGLALHAKPVVQDRVNIRINHGDLTALLYAQGYSVAEFAPV
ncbi:MAG: phosphoserine phosphatase SerB [Rhodobacteraceae bacterium]|nr:phosphoserine phosphatase SerB [Paracoccaceae bacterium]